MNTFPYSWYTHTVKSVWILCPTIFLCPPSSVEGQSWKSIFFYVSNKHYISNISIIDFHFICMMYVSFFFSPLVHDFSSYFFRNFGWRRIKIMLILWKKIMITIFFHHMFIMFVHLSFIWFFKKFLKEQIEKIIYIGLKKLMYILWKSYIYTVISCKI